MRKIALFMNVSVEGYFEGPNHDISWFKTGDEEKDAFTVENTKEGGAILLGHRTFDMMKSYWPTPQAKQAFPELAEYMNNMPKFVAGRKPFEPGWKNVTVLSGNVTGEVRKLKEQPGSSIVILGSNMLTVSLMEEGLVDEFRILVNTLAFGNGTPLFKGLSQKIDLKLRDARHFRSGNIQLTYEPRR